VDNGEDGGGVFGDTTGKQPTGAGVGAGTQSASRPVVTARSTAAPARAQQRINRCRALTTRHRCWRGPICLETETAVSFMKPFHRYFARYGQRWVVPRGLLWPDCPNLAKSRLFFHKAHREPPRIASTRNGG
jgi:hypothetical protein